ncbi:ATP-binding protein [Halobacteriovorax sp. HLS]|uniref:sensor histidine kinase n=1 Tax=Halobacteriovorax sp. HLS TaxID=2234000 RepID=UPI0013E40AB7|nr:ATP-binding protein [Halobacteriovorax sp. HLS]
MTNVDNQEKLLFFLNHLEEYVFELDRNGKVIFVSKHFDDSILKITGSSLHRHLPPESQLEFFKALDQSSTSLKQTNFNFQKGLCHYNMALIPILDSDHILCVVRNITELFKLQENALKDEARLLDAAVLNKISFWEYEFKNSQFHTSVELNRILDLPENFKIPSDDILKFISASTYAQYLVKFEECIREGSFELSHEVTTYKNEIRYLKVVGRVIKDNKGVPLSIVGSALDITDQKKEVESRCELDKMASIGKLAGSIGHEINNPLAIISGFSQKLMRLSNENNIDPEKIKYYAKKIEDTTYRVKKIVDSLSKVSRNTRDENDLKQIALSTVIEDALILCQEKFKSEGIRILSNHLTKDIALQTNPIEITQIFLNLLTNAYDAIYDLDERWVKIIIEDNYDSVLIRVIDSGKGISNELSKKILEPFFTTKPIGKGTGLGLSISRNIIEKNNGSIEISTYKGNTSFEIILPTKQAELNEVLLTGGYIPSREPNFEPRIQ